MFNINQKVRVLRRNDLSSAFNEVGKGTVKKVFTDKFGIARFVEYRDKDWPDNVSETLTVECDYFKVVPY